MSKNIDEYALKAYSERQKAGMKENKKSLKYKKKLKFVK